MPEPVNKKKLKDLLKAYWKEYSIESEDDYILRAVQEVFFDQQNELVDEFTAVARFDSAVWFTRSLTPFHKSAVYIQF